MIDFPSFFLGVAWLFTCEVILVFLLWCIGPKPPGPPAPC